MPAPIGNQNAAKGAEWREAIKRALTRASAKLKDNDEIGWRRGLDSVADKFIAAAEDGEPWAMKEIGDRIDGKPAQSVDLTGEVNIPLSGTVRFRKVNGNE